MCNEQGRGSETRPKGFPFNRGFSISLGSSSNLFSRRETIAGPIPQAAVNVNSYSSDSFELTPTGSGSQDPTRPENEKENQQQENPSPIPISMYNSSGTRFRRVDSISRDPRLYRMNTAVKLNQLMKEHSSDAKLIICNIPAPGQRGEYNEMEYISYIEAMTEDINSIMLVKGSGFEVVTEFY